jgi:hypothetical protein
VALPATAEEQGMDRFIRILAAAVAMLAICAPIASGHFYDDPEVDARNASAVTDTSAVLNAQIETNDDDGAFYRFQYGPGNYANQTQPVWLPGDDEVDVSVQVTGLTPSTNYQFRAVAWNDDGTDTGSKRNYSTASAAPGAGAPTTGNTAPPVLGQTVVAEATTGTVLVKEKGVSEFIPLEEAETIPVDSTIDTSAGTVALETAVAGGESQTGTFRGGKFQVRQSGSGKGMTTIALRGGDFSSCGSANRSVGALQRKLWGKDKGGRFKTSGKGSVATVRGTAWFTADTCNGTLTKVSHGAVKVRERGTGRSELVTRGESFFGHSPH